MKEVTPRIFGGIALLAILLSMGVASISAGPPPPNLRVDVTTHKVASGEAFDTILYVSVPHQRPFTPPLFNLLQSFVLQSIDITETAPDGTSTTFTAITCTNSGPAYPSRNTVVTCTGLFSSRVNNRAYPGSDTGISFIGFELFTAGHWTIAYTVTGLYNGATTTLTSSFPVNVDPPATGGPTQIF